MRVALTYVLAGVRDSAGQDTDPPVKRRVALDALVRPRRSGAGSSALQFGTDVHVAEAVKFAERLGRVGASKARDELRNDARRVGSDVVRDLVRDDVESEVEH